MQSDQSKRLREFKKAQIETKHKAQELYLAQGLHRVMKRTFRGIMSYPQRKILYKIGKNGK